MVTDYIKECVLNTGEGCMSGKSKKKSAEAVAEEQVENVAAEAATEEKQGGTDAEGKAAESDPLAELQQKLEQAQKKADENWDVALRTKAEMENLRKRSQRDVENAHKFGLEKIATELLSVRDSMELGLSAAQQEQADVNTLLEGSELTLKMLTQLMDKFEIVAVNPENERFDPELHQAMSMQESDKLEPNTVITVIQKGYTLNGRLLRPALVTVSKAAQ